MKNNSRIIPAALCLLLCLSMVLGGCANKVTLSGNVPVSEVNASSGEVLTITDEKSDNVNYFINVPLTIDFYESKKLAEEEMAEEFIDFIKRVSGKTLSKAKDASDSSKKMISIGETNAALSNTSLMADYKNLGKGGYIIRAIDGNLFILGNDIESEWRAIAYLTANFMNYDPEKDLTYPDENSILTITIPADINYTYKGDTIKNTLNYTAKTESPFTNAVCGDIDYATILSDTYAGYAYSYDLNSWTIDDSLRNKELGTDTTTCYSDSKVRADAIEMCINQITRKNKYAQFYYVSNNVCECSACKAAEAKYGCKNAAYWTLVNEAAKALQNEKGSKYKDSGINVVAYKNTSETPNFNMESNVHVYVTSRDICSAHAINDKKCERNAAFASLIESWTKISDDVDVLDFFSDYNYYPVTFPNLAVIRSNMSFYAKTGVESVSMVWSENAVDRELGNVRAMLFDYLAKDPNMSASTYNKIMKYVFIEYYGTPGQYIYEWYNLFAENAIDEFDIYTTPDELLPIASTETRNGTVYDTTLIEKGYDLWQKAHPFAGDILSKNTSNIAKMLCTTYDNNNAAHSMHQFSRWLYWNIPLSEATDVISPIVNDYYNIG